MFPFYVLFSGSRSLSFPFFPFSLIFVPVLCPVLPVPVLSRSSAPVPVLGPPVLGAPVLVPVLSPFSFYPRSRSLPFSSLPFPFSPVLVLSRSRSLPFSPPVLEQEQEQEQLSGCPGPATLLTAHLVTWHVLHWAAGHVLHWAAGMT